MLKLTSGHLFAGGGGDTEGAIAAEYTPLWAVEYDKYAAAVYRKRFPSVRLLERDIKSISDEEIRFLPSVNIIIGGSPCPDFSAAGSHQGLSGDRGSLFWSFIKFVEIKQPQAFIWENVAGVLSSNQYTAFPQIIQAFAELGYMGSWQIKNGIRHVPQNRPRIFCVGVQFEL